MTDHENSTETIYRVEWRGTYGPAHIDFPDWIEAVDYGRSEREAGSKGVKVWIIKRSVTYERIL